MRTTAAFGQIELEAERLCDAEHKIVARVLDFCPPSRSSLQPTATKTRRNKRRATVTKGRGAGRSVCAKLAS